MNRAQKTGMLSVTLSMHMQRNENLKIKLMKMLAALIKKNHKYFFKRSAPSCKTMEHL